MPQLLPAAAAWAAAAWSSAVTATAVGLTKIGVMAAIGEGATIALAGKLVATGAMMGLSAAASAMMRPNTPSSGTALDFKPDPKAPIRGAMGYTAVGANKAMQASWGYNRVALSLGVALSMGPIDSVVQFQADGSPVAFAGAQNEATGFYAADMWQKTTLGLPDYTVLTPPTGLKYGNPGLTGWGPQHAAPQVAFGFWTMVLAKNPEDRDVFTNGVPDPRWILRGMKVWDPRKDSTYPGGLGPQRRNDWRTWGFSENAWVHAIAWLRGHHKLNLDGTIDRTKRIAGVGAPDASIDLAAYVEGANVADANGWTISGEWSTGDGKWQTLASILQAGGGRPINRGAQISALVHAPRVSTYTYTKADLIGQAQIKPLTPRRDRKNTIIPRYRSEAHGWQYVAAGEVTAQTYRDEDRGEPRSTEVQYTLVRDAKQAGQLAAYDLANLREGLTATLPSKSYMQHIHVGDCITINEPELALVNQKVIVMRASGDYRSASWTLEVQSETDAKHPWALGQTDQAPSSPKLSAVDPNHVPPPRPDDWIVSPKPPAPDGTSQPIIIIVGKVETSDIAQIIIEHGPANGGPWTLAYSGVPSIEGRYEAKGLSPAVQYWVSIRYVAKNGATSDRLITGPWVAGKLVAGGVTDEARDQIVKDVLQDIDDIASGRDEAEKVAELVLETILNENDALVKEAKERGEGIAIAYQGATQYADTKIADATQTLATIVMLNDAQAATLFQSQSYTNGQLATAMNTVYTKAQTDSGLATTLQQAKAHADANKQEANLLFATKAERENGDASTFASMKSYVDAYKSEANLTFAAQSSLNGVSATAALALSTAQDAATKLNEARVRIIAAAGGGNPALVELYAGAAGSFVRLAAAQILFGDNTIFDDATDTMRTTIGSNIRVMAFGAPFGAAGNLLEWWGPSSVAIGAMTSSNGHNGRMTSAPYVFDNVISGGGDGGSSGYAEGRKIIGSTGVVGSSWNTIATFSPAGVPPSADIYVNVDWGGSQENFGATWIGECRLIQTSNGAVVAGPVGLQFGNMTSEPSTSLQGLGGLSGTVGYSLQLKKSSGGDLNNLTGAIDFTASQSL